MADIKIETRDEFGLTEAEWGDLREDTKRQDKLNRSHALCAIWFPKKAPAKAGRGDDFTIGWALRASVGIILNRHRSTVHEKNQRAKSGKYICGKELAYWSSNYSGYGYNAMVIWVYPHCRVEIFNDGESFL